MRISEIIAKLEAWCPMNRENRSDVPIYGDLSADVSRIGVCMIATPEVLRKAKSMDVQFLITHEPTFHTAISNFADETAMNRDPVRLAKQSLAAQVNIPIYRFHDHSHFTEIDKINVGFVNKVGLPGTFDGQKTLELAQAYSVDDLEQLLEERLDLHHIRFVGDRNKSVKRISLCVGAWGAPVLYTQLNRPEIDLVICGEICEWSICEYVRDSAQLGFGKAMFVLGHMGSERSGMEYICDYIKETMPEISAEYIECGEVYN